MLQSIWMHSLDILYKFRISVQKVRLTQHQRSSFGTGTHVKHAGLRTDVAVIDRPGAETRISDFALVLNLAGLAGFWSKQLVFQTETK